MHAAWRRRAQPFSESWSDREFGSSGDRIILEECLEGIEASYIVFTDGETILPAVAARDHKAALDNDAGPNTGGMGAYSNDDILGRELEQDVLKRVIRPTVEGMRDEGVPFPRDSLCRPDADEQAARKFWSSTSGWEIRNAR